MSALSNKHRKIYADGLARLSVASLNFEIDRLSENVRFAEIEAARFKAFRALANRELKRRKRKENAP